MRIQVIVILLCAATETSASIRELSCAETKTYIRSFVGLMRESVTDYDHTESIRNLRYDMQRCKISEQSLGFTRRASLREFERVNQQYLLDQAESRMSRLVDYRAHPNDADTIRRLRASLGRSTPGKEAELRRLEQQGRISEERERASCTPVDLRGPRLGPPRDQDSIGWCYAYAMADLLSYRLGVQVSAADLAVNFNREYKQPGAVSRTVGRLFGSDPDQKIREGGWVTETLEAAKKAGGACRESNFRSDDNGYNDLMKTLQQLARGSQANPNQCLSAARATFPTIPGGEVQTILASTAGIRRFETLANRACHPRISLAGIEAINISTFDRTPQKLTDQVDAQLNRKQPVSITYNAACIVAANCEGDRGTHESLIVARRFNAETRLCEYLVRNSWGRSCRGQGRGMDCEEGHVWMPKPDLHRGMYEITYLQ